VRIATRHFGVALALAASASAAAQSPADSTHGLFVGEKLEYVVTVGGARAGTGSMEIAGTDTIRGHHVYHSVFTTKGSLLFLKVNDVLESWFDPKAMISYRFIQRINEVNYHRVRIYEFYPERKMLMQEGKPAEEPMVAEPLDDGAFFYFVRTVPLVVGETYTFERYFRPEKNPVIVKVLRKDTVTVKAGTFPCIVIQPIIKSGGIFAEGGEALMWLSDDDRHILVQMKTKIPILQSLDLFLQKVTPGGTKIAADSAGKPADK
jgi:hypothetical protein